VQKQSLNSGFFELVLTIIICTIINCIRNSFSILLWFYVYYEKCSIKRMCFCNRLR